MDTPQFEAPELVARFEAHYGVAPTLLVRAPGRVNLIGEHTDYNGLPVLPMAIERAITIAAAPLSLAAGEEPRVAVASIDARFPTAGFSLRAPIEPGPRGDWSNYLRAAAQQLLQSFPLSSARLMVTGDIPAGAGLSSSSALVVAAGLTFTLLAGRDPDRRALAEELATAERYIGTASGGMDQAASLLGQAGHALRIDFDPLTARAVPLHHDYAFVVAHSLVVAEKASGARDAYNTRVGECRLALAALEGALGVETPLPHFGALQRSLPERSLASYLVELSRVLPEGELSLSELARGLEVDIARLRDRLPETVREREGWAPLARARHVLREAERVAEAEVALRAGAIDRFGALMNASHESCRDDYEISCEALEALIAAARAGGAKGARLTGAGFGGCTVNLVERAGVAELMAALQRDYYGRRAQGDATEHCFVFDARAGAQWRWT